jgi:hypothetical protein
METLKTFLWGLAAAALFIAIGVWLMDSPGHREVMCYRGRCISGGGAGFGMLCTGIMFLYLVYRSAFPSTKERQEKEDRERMRRIYAPPPQCSELPSSKNPRYRRIDNFVSMADVPLDSKDYEYQKRTIAAVRKRHGYPPEVEV